MLGFKSEANIGLSIGFTIGFVISLRIGLNVGFNIGFVIPAAYGALLVGFGIKQAVVERSPALIMTPVAFAAIHISFGTGMIAGSVRWLIRPCPHDGRLSDRWLSGDRDG